MADFRRIGYPTRINQEHQYGGYLLFLLNGGAIRDIIPLG